MYWKQLWHKSQWNLASAKAELGSRLELQLLLLEHGFWDLLHPPSVSHSFLLTSALVPGIAVVSLLWFWFTMCRLCWGTGFAVSSVASSGCGVSSYHWYPTARATLRNVLQTRARNNLPNKSIPIHKSFPTDLFLNCVHICHCFFLFCVLPLVSSLELVSVRQNLNVERCPQQAHNPTFSPWYLWAETIFMKNSPRQLNFGTGYSLWEK